MAKLTIGMIKHLNKVLKDDGVGFKYKFTNESIAPKARIEVEDGHSGFVNSSIINCTDIYFNWLEKWFKDNYNIKIIYNNTKTIIWSNDYSVLEDKEKE